MQASSGSSPGLRATPSGGAFNNPSSTPRAQKTIYNEIQSSLLSSEVMRFGGKRKALQASPPSSSSSSSSDDEDHQDAVRQPSGESERKKKKGKISAPEVDTSNLEQQAKKKAKINHQQAESKGPEKALNSPASSPKETKEAGVQTKRVSFKSQVATFAASASASSGKDPEPTSSTTTSSGGEARQHTITDLQKLEADRAKDKKRVDKLLTAFNDSDEEVAAAEEADKKKESLAAIKPFSLAPQAESKDPSSPKG